VVDYSYNADDKITQLTDWLSNSINFTYNNDSKITYVTYPTNGTYSLSVSLLYDTMGFLTSEEINGSSSGNILTQRNLEEPISSVQVNNGNPQPVSYNVANQLTQGSTQSNSGTDYYYGYLSYGNNSYVAFGNELNCITQPNTSNYCCSNPNSSYTSNFIYKW
jgi:hypothetical protein